MREGQWKRGLLQEMEAVNARVFHIIASAMQEPGWPDEYICHKYWQGFIEFKNTKTKIELAQTLVNEALNERQPGQAFIVRRPDRIETGRGELIAHFDGTGRGLILKLAELTDEMKRRSV